MLGSTGWGSNFKLMKPATMEFVWHLVLILVFATAELKWVRYSASRSPIVVQDTQKHMGFVELGVHDLQRVAAVGDSSEEKCGWAS